jgi:hypothetical protein
MRLLRSAGIRVVTFPPHVTHILQPIDVVIARAFKAAIAQFHSDIQLEDLPDFVPDPTQMTAIAIQRFKLVYATVSAIQRCMTLALTRTSFRKAGLYPYNIQQVLSSPYVHASPSDPEAAARQANPNKLYISSSDLTSNAMLAALDAHARTTRKPDDSVLVALNFDFS